MDIPVPGGRHEDTWVSPDGADYTTVEVPVCTLGTAVHGRREDVQANGQMYAKKVSARQF